MPSAPRPASPVHRCTRSTLGGFDGQPRRLRHFRAVRARVRPTTRLHRPRRLIGSSDVMAGLMDSAEITHLLAQLGFPLAALIEQLGDPPPRPEQLLSDLGIDVLTTRSVTTTESPFASGAACAYRWAATGVACGGGPRPAGRSAGASRGRWPISDVALRHRTGPLTGRLPSVRGAIPGRRVHQPPMAVTRMALAATARAYGS